MNNPKYVITNPDGSIQIMDESNYVKSVYCGFENDSQLFIIEEKKLKSLDIDNNPSNLKEHCDYLLVFSFGYGVVEKNRYDSIYYKPLINFEWPGMFEENTNLENYIPTMQ